MKRILGFLALMLFACSALAQDPTAGYPNRPLRFIVPYPPGALIKFGMEPWVPNTPEQFAEIVRNDVGRWAAVVKAAGLKVD